MLKTIFNGKLAEMLMLSLYRQNEVYASALAREADLTLSAIQKQLVKFEKAGLLVSREVGKTKLFSFNASNPYVRPLIEMIKIADRAEMVSNAQTTNDLTPKKEVDQKLWLY